MFIMVKDSINWLKAILQLLNVKMNKFLAK